ncbi:hypothetical protein JCM3774_001558 [Rhodotorula dairenensis]
MLSTTELASALFGFWSMGGAIALFVPEFIDVWRHPMPNIDIARFIFFAAWLVGDAVMLAGLVIMRKFIITQVVLYSVVFALEVALLLLMLWTVGDLCCAARVKRPSDGAVVGQLVAGIHGRLHMPPGDNTLKNLRAERARNRGELTPAERGRRRTKYQIYGTIALLAGFTLVWLFVDFLPRDERNPPSRSFLPDPKSANYVAQNVGYILAWLGVPCWVLPRLYCLYDSFRRRAREGITVASILLGLLTHGTNVTSVMLINNRGDALQAQLPYILTSVLCIVLDVLRLGLKHLLQHAKQLPPEYDYSNMWPYERLLPGYDPQKYANVKEKLRSQPILSDRWHSRVPSSNGELVRPSDKMEQHFGQVHTNHVHALKHANITASVVALPDTYLDMRPKAAPFESSEAQLRQATKHNEDLEIVTKANRNWARFRAKQVRLHNLERQLDDLREEQAVLSKAVRGQSLPHEPELQQDAKSVKEDMQSLEQGMRDLVADRERGLTDAWQRQLETELEAYIKHARNHSRVIRADPCADTPNGAYAKWDLFRQARNRLRGLQQQLDSVKTASIELEQQYATDRLHRRDSSHSIKLEKDMLKRRLREDELVQEIDTLLADTKPKSPKSPTSDPAAPSDCATPLALESVMDPRFDE